MTSLMNDDDLNEFTYDLSDFLEERGWVSSTLFESDEEYDELTQFVFEQLSKFSVGPVFRKAGYNGFDL